ncbi:chemotaxis protein CheA [Methanomicrobiaceae archaeon CYW5]|uniref:chemotaxis protein CheA n=1 Tax=Methanovulcanius yangii TaxID=1789227 RepID=UPI0029CA871E|nr:chemotaxis protein CheA [Methanovulcanius yangii]MBT8507300.1 chemotaxis protein CheA [Methanovulcanius yangii]
MSDDDTYRKLFVAESQENHENIVNNLLVLEEGSDPTAIDEIFRAAHTLKGMAASMGYTVMENLCHSMEDVFDDIRNGSKTVTPGLVDLLLTCTDTIDEMLDDIERGGDSSSVDANELVGALRAAVDESGEVSGNNEQDADTSPSPASLQENNAGILISASGSEESPTSLLPRYHLCLTVEKDCMMKDVRALIALENLKQMATIITTIPEEAELDEGKFEGTLDVILVSDAGREALLSAANVTDISSTEITEISPDIPEREVALSIMDEMNPGENENGQKRHEKSSKGVQNIRVDLTKLDHMMTMVEDLVINGGRLRQLARQYNLKEVDEAMGMVSRSISELQNMMINIRMIPLNQIFKRFPRVVRDVAVHDGKDVEFLMEGGDTEMDRGVIDGLGDPLLHLIRNAVNHGIERPEERIQRGKDPKGTIRLRAWRERGNVLIELSDDGGGINPDAVLKKALQKGLVDTETAETLSKEEITAFLFQPGFSTAETITDISGRGVGLDVVKSTIESLQGSIAVSSEPGNGTTFTLTLPPTMAILEVMMVRINGRKCAIPINSVVEVARINPKEITRIGKSEAIPFRDDVLQIHRLEEMFGMNVSGDIIVVVQYQGHKCCVPVDIVEGQQEVVVKPLSRVIGTCRGVSGVTIPGDGDVIPIIDVNTMV